MRGAEMTCCRVSYYFWTILLCNIYPVDIVMIKPILFWSCFHHCRALETRSPLTWSVSGDHWSDGVSSDVWLARGGGDEQRLTDAHQHGRQGRLQQQCDGGGVSQAPGETSAEAETSSWRVLHGGGVRGLQCSQLQLHQNQIWRVWHPSLESPLHHLHTSLLHPRQGSQVQDL